MKRKGKMFSLRFRVLNFLSGDQLRTAIKDARYDIDMLRLFLAATSRRTEATAEKKYAVRAKERIDALDKTLYDMFYL